MATIDMLHAATIQVLTQGGLSRCTTTRVAERAGVSVGSLYQYYPNRDALLAAVLERHLNGVLAVVEETCRTQKGMPVSVMASELVTAYLAVKLRDPAESRALYAVAGERGGPELMADLQSRIIKAVSAMLESASDVYFPAPDVTAAVVLHAVAGPVIALLNGDTPTGYGDALREQLVRLVTAYLHSSSQA
ncbi:TetR/AcrR family transcriptional regulator [Celeribacter indicus]|uniref:TetR family transcriptional regulator n=1 Tax=Celeribacter indicus TaxID=1208324 RepID=A0A0B5DZC5_9RHOB|nr:TetR/AcrR family transcriptional regulator [Celeribacter indicus]AJE48803.1 TetR family transcriptional regulator [Celeribacter indicus]